MGSSFRGSWNRKGADGVYYRVCPTETGFGGFEFDVQAEREAANEMYRKLGFKRMERLCRMRRWIAISYLIVRCFDKPSVLLSNRNLTN